MLKNSRSEGILVELKSESPDKTFTILKPYDSYEELHQIINNFISKNTGYKFNTKDNKLNASDFYILDKKRFKQITQDLLSKRLLKSIQSNKISNIDSEDIYQYVSEYLNTHPNNYPITEDEQIKAINEILIQSNSSATSHDRAENNNTNSYIIIYSISYNLNN